MPEVRIACNHRDDEFNVLNHGDCSQLNMLFVYDDDIDDDEDDHHKPIDCVFVS